MSSQRELASVLASMLPGAVASDVVVSDSDDASTFAEELAAVSRAVPARRREFFTARACARRALGRLGYADVAIPQGVDRSPQWPKGISGSLTHCDGLRAAAVARLEDIRALGIDAEINAPLPTGVDSLVLIDTERTMIADLAAGLPAIAWDRVLFSAKESVYKAWSPLSRSWLDFTDCQITIDPEAGEFRADLTVAGAVSRSIAEATGRWARVGDHVLTAITLSR